MVSIINIVNLWYNDNRSDKVYNVKLELADPNNQTWTVDFEYGRRGNNLIEGTKTPSPTNYQKAKQIFDKLVASKTNKGYEFIKNQKQLQRDVASMLLKKLDLFYEKQWVTNNEYTKLQGLLQSNDDESQVLAERIINKIIIK